MLKFGIERSLFRISAVDPFIAQHLAALGHAAFVAFLFVHGGCLYEWRKLSTVSV